MGVELVKELVGRGPAERTVVHVPGSSQCDQMTLCGQTGWSDSRWRRFYGAPAGVTCLGCRDAVKRAAPYVKGIEGGE